MKYIDISTVGDMVFLYDNEFITLLYSMERRMPNETIIEVLVTLELHNMSTIDIINCCRFLNHKEKEYYKLKYG